MTVRRSVARLPHDDRLGMVGEVLAHAGHIVLARQSERLEILARTNARVQQQTRRVDGTRAQDASRRAVSVLDRSCLVVTLTP